MTFEEFCASRHVTLLQHQRAFAEVFIRNAAREDAIREFMSGGPGSGKTLTLALLESYFEWIRSNPGTEPTMTN